jgi:hypothetical protein
MSHCKVIRTSVDSVSLGALQVDLAHRIVESDPQNSVTNQSSRDIGTLIRWIFRFVINIGTAQVPLHKLVAFSILDSNS